MSARDLLLLRDIASGLPVKEAAARRGCSEDAAKVALYRLRHREHVQTNIELAMRLLPRLRVRRKMNRHTGQLVLF